MLRKRRNLKRWFAKSPPELTNAEPILLTLWRADKKGHAMAAGNSSRR
jgi:hypothetical protein